MEPRREEPQKALDPSAAQKPKRFRIVKLEERIAPKKGGGGNTHGHTCTPPPTVEGPTCPTSVQTLCGCPTEYPYCPDPW